MIDVFSDNFDTLLPEIKESIENACFVAIDTEFTGLISSKSEKPSLFDNAEQRYHKLRETAAKYVVCQLGLAIFKNDSETNRYWCKAYNFYLHPPAFGSIDNTYACQPSSLKFLTCHGFDFNKFIFRGIPYLKDEEEETVTKEIKHKTYLLNMERDGVDNELQLLCSRVSSWISVTNETELLLDKITGIRDYIQVNEIRHHFPNTWASINADGKIVVSRVSNEERLELEQQSVYEDEKMVTSILGFTQVFRFLVRAKKPIIGHNMFMDLLFMYHHLYKPLPKSYHRFKMECHKLFPVVFDTKHILLSNRKMFEKAQIVEVGRLENTYRNFVKSSFSVLYVPHIVIEGHAANDAGPEIKPHEAGSDAYAAGYIFVRMAHILSMENTSAQVTNVQPWSFHRNATISFANHINLIRALNSSMNLAGPDPSPERPQWLVVQSKNNFYLNAASVAEMLSRFGCIDVKPLHKNSMLVAVSTFGCARDILREFRHHEVIQVSPYNRLRHSRSLRLFLWSALLMSSSFSLLLAFKLVKPLCSK